MKEYFVAIKNNESELLDKLLTERKTDHELSVQCYPLRNMYMIFGRIQKKYNSFCLGKEIIHILDNVCILVHVLAI